MSTTGFGSFLIAKPEVEWKSAWRREFERRSAEEAAARRLAASLQPRPARCAAQPKAKRERKPRAAKPERRPKLLTLCACGREIRVKERLHCAICAAAPKRLGVARKCGCGRQLNANNATGLCRPCFHLRWRREREVKLKGARPVCRYQADGMRCTQRLYRDNDIGLCGFHSGRQMGGTYRKSGPQMVAIAESESAA